MSVRNLTVATGLAALLAGCASNPPTPKPTSAPITTSQNTPLGAESFHLVPTNFSEIPDWNQTDLWPALLAFRRHCDVIMRRTPDTPLSGRYGGITGDWQPACREAATIQYGQERWFFESYFTPARVVGESETRLTAYYEPVVEARRSPEPGFSEPFLRRPNDMVTIDLGAFADMLDNDELRGGPRSLTGRLNGDRIEPYPERGKIAPAPGQVIAWGHPADVYNLQVQGSGRLAFPDGSQVRAAFSAQNGRKWNSALGALRASGAMAAVSWPSFRLWLDNNPGREGETLNADPSYVFFEEQPIADPSEGPRGAAGIPLTAMGSIAVDPAYHPYGAIVFVDGTFDNAPFRRLLVAQDTGGAIRRGPLRGDVFFGSGPEAGSRAEQMNAAANWWTLLPRPVVEQPFVSNDSAGGRHG